MNLKSFTLFKTLAILVAALAILGLVNTSVGAESPVPETAFTYQGRLTDGGEPADDAYDFQFRLYTDSVSGAQVGPVVTMEDEPVNAGLFSVVLDFSQAFKGTMLYLETGVRKGSKTGAYTTLSPRQHQPPRRLQRK